MDQKSLKALLHTPLQLDPGQLLEARVVSPFAIVSGLGFWVLHSHSWKETLLNYYLPLF